MTTISRNARVAGLVYILASAVGIVRLLYVPAKLFVRGDAAVTAANIAAHETLFRLGIVSNVIGGVIWLFVPLALYRLLKDVDRTLAILMVIVGGVMQVPVYIVNAATDAAALTFVRGAGYLDVFTKPQRDAFARLFLDVHHQLDLANMIWAGLWLLPFGLLVYKSRFLPRILGIWLMLACIPYVALFASGFLWPGSEETVLRYGQPLMLSEVATMLWMTIAGARERPLLTPAAGSVAAAPPA